MPSADTRTLSAVTVLPHAFHEFQPSGGVSASMWSPPTIVICPVALPFAFVTVTSTTVRPAFVSDPVMSPVCASSVRPAGRFFAANVSGSSPDAGIRNMNGRPGVAPVIVGELNCGADDRLDAIGGCGFDRRARRPPGALRARLPS